MICFSVSQSSSARARPPSVQLFISRRQLDLFDTVMNEDMKGAKEVMENEKLPEVEVVQDPPAIASMRSLIEKLEDKYETRALVELIAANMERMRVAHCDAKHWKKIRYCTEWNMRGEG